MSKEVSPQETLALVQAVQSMAPIYQASRSFGLASKDQAAVAMYIAAGLGIHPGLAFQYIDMIDGKPSLKPKGALALIQASSEYAGMSIEEKTDAQGNPASCTVHMKRRNGFEFTTTFTIDDAKRAGIVKPKSGWDKYPANMLRWRAIGYCADIVFPDVIGGLVRSDDLGADLTPEGNTINGSWTVAESTVQVAAATPSPPPVTTLPTTVVEEVEKEPEITVAYLLANGYTAPEIMAANDDVIPPTVEDCIRVKATIDAQREKAQDAES